MQLFVLLCPTVYDVTNTHSPMLLFSRKRLLHSLSSIRSPGPVAPMDVNCEGFHWTYTRIAYDEIRSQSRNKQHYLDKKVDSGIEDFFKNLIQIGPELLSVSSSVSVPSLQRNIDHPRTKVLAFYSFFRDQHLHNKKKVTNNNNNNTITTMLVSPHAQGCLTLSFFERRESKQLFGLVKHEEKVIWEQWILHVVVNNTPRPVDDDTASRMERQRIQDTAEAMLKSVFLKIFQYASGVDDRIVGTTTSMGMEDDAVVGAGAIAGCLDHIPPTMYEFEIRSTKKVNDRENLVSRVANMPALLNLDGS